jgi:methionyl-tRNA synthetase
MENNKNFYITTTLPYVNSDPHLGFALEIVQADVIARYHNLLGEAVFFNTGTDEHGIKIYRKAEAEGKAVQAYVDEYAEKFKQLKNRLGLYSDIHFIRTTDAHHVQAAQEFWKRCDAQGDICKKNYTIKYCVGCELEKTDSELVDGKCPLHPNLEIELINEENYFFRWSKYQQPLMDFYAAHPDFVVPDFRFNEIKQFVKDGLQDFSVSRLKEKMPWGVPVPGDDQHVMYVWFDALVNYISTLGWPESLATFEQFWGTKDYPNALQVAGKDNLRQQSAMWQAMLMSAGLPNTRQIVIHGFITSGGQKMSKSLGNVADPYAILEKLQSLGLDEEQAVDALRYYLLREIPTFEDGDYTWEKFLESYNASLANGIGNLVSRVMKMVVSNDIHFELEKWNNFSDLPESDEQIIEYNQAFASFDSNKAIDIVWRGVKQLDGIIQSSEPFKKIKHEETKDEAENTIRELVSSLHELAHLMQPFLPNTSVKIIKALKEPTLESIPRLFPRIE